MRASPHVLAAIAAALVAAACGSGSGTPTAPSAPSRLHLREGLQILDVIGFGLSSDPQFPACTPLGSPRAGTMISTHVMLQQSGDQWIARSPASDGSLELRIRDTGSSSVLGDLVTGTIQGQGTDLGQELRPPNGVSATFASTTLDGAVQRSAFLTTGRLAGTIAFSDETTTGNCTAVQWSMQPTTGIFLTAPAGLK